MNSNKKIIYFGILLSILFGSCFAPRYLSNKQKVPDIVYEQYPLVSEPYRLQPYDYLYVNIRTTDKDINELFTTISSQFSSSLSQNEANFYLTGYMINDSGYVYIPFVGNLPAGGKTLDEVRRMISDSLSRIISDAVINVRLASYNVFFLGAFNIQGKIPFYRDRVNILEAIAKANGIDGSGDKRHVMIIRRKDTIFEIYELDLTKRKILENKNFFVQPNDLIYVPERPGYKVRLFISEYSSFLTFVSTTITTVLLIMSLKK